MARSKNAMDSCGLIRLRKSVRDSLDVYRSADESYSDAIERLLKGKKLHGRKKEQRASVASR